MSRHSKSDVFVLRKNSTVRKAAELSSELSDSVAEGMMHAGTRVHVLQAMTLPDGTDRRCLALEGRDEALGWVSGTIKGIPNLVPAALFSKDGSSLSGMLSSRGTATVARSPFLSESRRHMRSDRAPKDNANSFRLESEPPSPAAVKRKGSISGSGARAISAKALLSAAKLQMLAADLERQAVETHKAHQANKSVAVLLGEALLDMGAKIPQLIKQWAKNGEVSS